MIRSKMGSLIIDGVVGRTGNSAFDDFEVEQMLREGLNDLCRCPHGCPIFRAIRRRAIVSKEENKGSSLTFETSKRGSKPHCAPC